MFQMRMRLRGALLAEAPELHALQRTTQPSCPREKGSR